MRMPVPSSMVASAPLTGSTRQVDGWGVTEIARRSFLCNDDGNNDSRDTAVSKRRFLDVRWCTFALDSASRVFPYLLSPSSPLSLSLPAPRNRTLGFKRHQYHLGRYSCAKSAVLTFTCLCKWGDYVIFLQNEVGMCPGKYVGQGSI